VDLSHQEDDCDHCSCCFCYHDDYDFDDSPSDPALITCPGCGTVAAPSYGFDHFDPECFDWSIAMVMEEDG
jgi:hypothetical protein